MINYPHFQGMINKLYLLNLESDIRTPQTLYHSLFIYLFSIF
jgi:hypothetical protein